MDAHRESLLAVAGYWTAASGVAAPARPSAAVAGSAAGLVGGPKAAGAASPGGQGSDSGAVRTAGAAASGGASAAVEPAAVWASLGPGAAAQEEGLDVQKSALLQFLPPPEDSAEGPDDSVSESQSKAAGTVTSATEHSRLAVAASV